MATGGHTTVAQTATSDFNPSEIQRPDPVLLKYYAVIALASGPLFPVAFIPMLCKYLTLRYRFDDDGVAMQWGVLFRREIYLTYRRIQDIHLTRNIIQRWMGLANVAIQTASGSSAPEMTIEGVLVAEPLRDYLYSKMRGAKGQNDAPTDARAASESSTEQDEVLQLLRQIRDGLKSQLPQTEAN